MSRSKSVTARKRRPRAPRARPILPPLDPLRRYPFPIAAAYLGRGRSAIFELAKAGLIDVIEEASRRFIPGGEIVRLSRPPEPGDTRPRPPVLHTRGRPPGRSKRHYARPEAEP
jgi:hypothetical protein